MSVMALVTALVTCCKLLVLRPHLGVGCFSFSQAPTALAACSSARISASARVARRGNSARRLPPARAPVPERPRLRSLRSRPQPFQPRFALSAGRVCVVLCCLDDSTWHLLVRRTQKDAKTSALTRPRSAGSACRRALSPKRPSRIRRALWLFSVVAVMCVSRGCASLSG